MFKNLRKQDQKLPKISLIIPAYNEEKVIGRKLKNSMGLDYPKENLEIIVVNDNSKDNTKKIVDEYAKKHNNILSLSNKYNQGKVYSMKTAFEKATGDFIAITDADVILEKNIVKNSLNHFNDPKMGALCGADRIVQDPNNKISQAEEKYRTVWRTIATWESKLDSSPSFNGQFMFIKREALPDFNPNIDGEDADAAIKIRRKGYRVICAEDCVFHEEAASNLEQYKKQKIRRARGLVYVFWHHKSILFNPKYGWFGMLIFPFEFFSYIFQPIALFLVILGLFVFLSWLNLFYSLAYAFLILVFFRISPFKSYLMLNTCLLKAMYETVFLEKSGRWENIR